MKDLAPIILFVYNRPEHTIKVIKALQENEVAKQSLLYIYADGPRQHENITTLSSISKVRAVIDSITGFRSVVLKKADHNIGLANSIINGVTEVLEVHKKVIVLEDDLIVGKYFLDYMNDALHKYEKVDEVKQISGFSFPFKKKSKNESFFLPLTTTWGWATWERVWDEIDFECKDYTALKEDKALAKKFNLDGAYDYTKMLVTQIESEGKISSWGIRFWWNIFKRNGLVLYPNHSLVKNIGWDGSGRHGDNYEVYSSKGWGSRSKITLYPAMPSANLENTLKIKKFIKRENNYFLKILKKMKHYFLVDKYFTDDPL